jgi:hypothetical protein
MLCQGAFVANWFVRNRGKVLGVVTIDMPLSTATFTLNGDVRAYIKKIWITLKWFYIIKNLKNLMWNLNIDYYYSFNLY